MRVIYTETRTPKQLGNLIRQARKNYGLGQAELGMKTGLPQATISEIKAGPRRRQT